MVPHIKYRAGYKYQLEETYTILIPITGHECSCEFVSLDCAGRLVIREGYAWNGPSGPAIDTSTFMRGSLVHDALYQLMREAGLPHACRQAADQILRDICKADGMMAVRAWWVYRAVRAFASPSANPANDRPIRIAP